MAISAEGGAQLLAATAGRRLIARVIDWGVHVAVGVGMLMMLIVVLGLMGTTPYFGIGGYDTDPPVTVLKFQTAVEIYDNLLLLFAVLVYAFIVGAVAAFLHEVPLVALRGQTIGKTVVGIAVVRIDGGGAPGWGRSCTRWGVLYLPLLVPFVGTLLTLLVVLSPVVHPRRRGWHDLVAGTIVVRLGPVAERPVTHPLAGYNITGD